jgi:hypothetical protein
VGLLQIAPPPLLPPRCVKNLLKLRKRGVPMSVHKIRLALRCGPVDSAVATL